MVKVHHIIETVAGAVPDFRVEKSCDTLKAGDADAVVRGIAVTFIATREVLQRAVKVGANLIITHEPTFYNDERLTELAGDPVVESKRRFIADHALNVWRCHDSMHRMKPDMIHAGVSRQLGWEGLARSDNPELFDLPDATTLHDVAIELKEKLAIPAVRAVGDPRLLVRRVALSCGSMALDHHRMLLNQPGVDLLVCGEVREWETCEYVRDGPAAGRAAGLIVLGHCNSEEAGMQYLAQWLGERIKEVPIHFLPAADPFVFL